MLRRLIAAGMFILSLSAASVQAKTPQAPAKLPATWTADNGNGTFTNPLFYDEFSDPDIVRAGDWFYLTGTTMHAMPGLPILRSKDLVNWEFVAYAMDRLDLGPGYRLEDGKGIYGQGIWAPSFRYHNGTFYIFSNVNGQKTQIFTATDPKGPWTHKEMKRSMHDLSVLFDDDGKAYAIWGYQGIRMAELTPDLSDIIEGTEREIIPKTAGMGEGVHFYKLDGKYFITSAWYEGRMRMPAARADNIWGPYEVNKAISSDEDFGLSEGHRLSDMWARSDQGPFTINPPNPAPNGRMSLHQGGIVQTPAGEWWGFSMMDYNSVGRLLGLSPITWKDGWPYFGLPGNLGRTPRTWVKPKTAEPQAIHAPYERNDDFSGTALKPIWQWNHVPVDGQWSLSARPGYLRLNALAAKDFWTARNSLTQRAIGPESSPVVVLETGGMKPGDVAGLALLNRPYAWIGIERTKEGVSLAQYDQTTGKTARAAFKGKRVWLKADADFMTEKAGFSYSTDGKTFKSVGVEMTMVFQLKTFQGVRYTLFNYHTGEGQGGYADFDSVEIKQPHPHGLMQPIPYGKEICLMPFGPRREITATIKDGIITAQGGIFTIVDVGQGRVGLRMSITPAGVGSFVSVNEDGSLTLKSGLPGHAESFQWIETPTGELVLMSLLTNRFLRLDPASSANVTADSPGPQSDAKDGVRFKWKLNSEKAPC